MRNYVFLAALACVCLSTQASGLKTGELSQVTRLTADAAAKYENPRFSPDGRQVAFTNFGYDGLYVMNTDGSGLRQVSEAAGVGYGYKWSADAQRVLVRDTRWEGAEGNMTRAHAALVIDVADGSVEKVSEDHAYMQPAMWRYDQRGNATIVSDVERVAFAKPLALKPNDAELLLQQPDFTLGFITDTEHLWTVDAMGMKAEIYTGCALEPSLSPDGRRVAFSDEYDNIKVMNIDGSDIQTVAKGFRPSWLNDGQLIYERTTDDGHTYLTGELYMVSLDSKAEKALTASGTRIEMNVSVSPDGNRILFTDFNDGQVYMAEIR